MQSHEAATARNSQLPSPASIMDTNAAEPRRMPDLLDKRILLGEIEGLRNTMPPRATIHHETQENHDWFGRVSAAIEKWNPSKRDSVREYLDLFYSNRHARETGHGLNKLLVLLGQAQADLRLETGQPSTTRDIGNAAGADIIEGRFANVESTPLATSPHAASRPVFIGHGRSPVWHQLNSFLTERLHLSCVEFNSESVAGIKHNGTSRNPVGGSWVCFPGNDSGGRPCRYEFPCA